jgi:hypothetical protein
MSNVVEVQFSDKQLAIDALKEPVEGGILLATDKEGMYQVIHFGAIQPYLYIGLLQRVIKDLLDQEEEED